MLSIGNGTIGVTAVLRLKESRPFDFLFMIRLLFKKLVMISSNDSLVMLEAVDSLMKSKIQSISGRHN